MSVNELPESDTDLALRCAQMFFLEDLSKIEIAEALGVSRFKVARLLTAARELGLITVKINEPTSSGRSLGDELQAQFGLEDVAIVPSTRSLEALGQAGAEMLGRHLQEGDVVGVGWGRTVNSVVSAMSRFPTVSGVDVVQLAGGVVTPGPDFDPTGQAARLAAALSGSLTPLHAPAFLGSAATRRALLTEPSIAAALDAFEHLTIAILGIGALGTDADSALVAADTLPAKAREELAKRGATADLACHFFAEDGTLVRGWESRTLSVGLPALRAARVRIGVAAGESKAAAVRAVLRSGTINVLVTDTTCARAVLG
ncbi:sugar-binding transcriptional regulator [Pedococcus sp. NPDC057267]|uniref:sugar-binding transcriptional regulator n=1 Tax=Pedococcus sp. NPDC057267 TaxID=3346077 RepID=UPI00362D02B6